METGRYQAMGHNCIRLVQPPTSAVYLTTKMSLGSSLSPGLMPHRRVATQVELESEL
jgi:hypothetical protein